MFLHNEHYDVITSMNKFCGSKFYCEGCEKPYDKVEDHKCSKRCFICYRLDCTPDSPIRCIDCDRQCLSFECYNFHKKIAGNRKTSYCDDLYQCRDCCKVIKRRKRPMHLHRCGEIRCKPCNTYVMPENHRCHLNVKKTKNPSTNLMFFDFETDQSSGEHIVNFAVCQYFDGEEVVFSGYDSLDKFCSFLIRPQNKDCIAIAHNMKGFDGQFVLRWMLEQGLQPKVIPNGSKLMSIEVKSLNIRIIDSFNFLPMSLAKLPATFGLIELKKGYFPHFFNTPENQDYIGPLPGPQFYNPDAMSTSERQKFYSWYEERKAEPFDFRKEMLEYCR